jgi:peptidoglycan/LPS O-acetylase OafA/YrhL
VGVSMRTRSTPHWRGLDGMRALAVIAVVFYHFSPNTLPGGFLGVDVFFGISGYLITRLITEEFLRRGRIDAPAFYRRRARRLLPALAFLLAAVSTAALIWRDQLATVRAGVLSTAVFGGNWWLVFDHQSYFVSTGRPSMLQHLWSLGVEEQFYLVWPLITAATLAAGRRRGMDPRRMVSRLCAVAVGGAVASTALTWLLADLDHVPYGNDGSSLYYGTETHCMGLLLGAALGAWSAQAARSAQPFNVADHRWPILPPVWLERAIEVSGAVALVLLAVLTDQLTRTSHTLYRGDFLLVGFLVVVVIAVATRAESLVGRLLEIRPLRWIGVRSYSIYLWHWPITVITRPGIDTTMPIVLDQLLRIVLTVGLAEASYRYVEAPVRRLGFRPAVSAAAERVREQWRRIPPPVGVAGPIALAVLSLVGALVVVIGPAAPTPTAAAGANAGGRHLSLAVGSATQSGGGTGDAVPHPTHLPKLSGFGDSVMLGARAALAQKFGGSIDAQIGRQPDPILADALARARRGTLAPLVVLHVGNNGLIDPSVLSQTLRAMSKVRLVLVLTDHLTSADYWRDPNNKTIKRVVPKFANARVVDWNALASTHRDWLDQDDLHLIGAGEAAYARIIANAYRAYLTSQAGG